MRRFAPLLALLATAILAGTAAAACRTSCLHLPQDVTYCTPAAKVDTTVAHDPGYECSCFTAGFDVPNATLYVTSCSSFGMCYPRVTVEDDFTLGGLPAGTPVAFTARFDAALTASDFMGPGDADARLVEGAANAASVHHELWQFYGNTVSTPLSVPVVAIAGTPFHMLYEVRGTVGELCNVEWHGAFSFADLPAGVTVTSCNGFVQGPTPARTRSWGSVKAAYR